MKFNTKGIIHRLTAVQQLPITTERAWDFFSSPKNLATITPDKMNFKILSGAETSVFAGQIIQYKVNPLPFFSVTWVTEITQVEHLKFFIDEQRYGPYSFWHHKHFIKPIKGGVEMEDIVDYKVPFGWFGRTLTKRFIQKELRQIFDYRNKKLIELFGEFKP